MNPQPAAQPFAFADFSWMPGNYAPAESPISTKYFTPEIRLDTAYHYDFSNPQDDTISGSSEVFRPTSFRSRRSASAAISMYNNVGFRLMTQFGMYSADDSAQRRESFARAVEPRQCVSLHFGSLRDVPHRCDERDQHPGRDFHVVRGAVELLQLRQLDLSAFLRFVEYAVVFQRDARSDLPIGQAEDRALAHQWLAVLRQIRPSTGLGLQSRCGGRLDGSAILGNQYYGSDDSGLPDRRRFHTDDSVMVKYYEKQGGGKASARRLRRSRWTPVATRGSSGASSTDWLRSPDPHCRTQTAATMPSWASWPITAFGSITTTTV